MPTDPVLHTERLTITMATMVMMMTHFLTPAMCNGGITGANLPVLGLPSTFILLIQSVFLLFILTSLLGIAVGVAIWGWWTLEEMTLPQPMQGID